MTTLPTCARQSLEFMSTCTCTNSFVMSIQSYTNARRTCTEQDLLQNHYHHGGRWTQSMYINKLECKCMGSPVPCTNDLSDSHTRSCFSPNNNGWHVVANKSSLRNGFLNNMLHTSILEGYSWVVYTHNHWAPLLPEQQSRMLHVYVQGPPCSKDNWIMGD